MKNELSNIRLKLVIFGVCMFFTINCEKSEPNSSINKETAPPQSIIPNAKQIVKVTGKPCPELFYESEKENPRCVKLTVKLISASANGDVTGIKDALEAGASINAGYSKIYPALFQAAAQGWKDAVVLLLDNGADVNNSLTFGLTPLADAVINQHREIVKILLERGAAVCPADSDGPTLLQHANWYEKNQEIADLLKQAGGENCK